ncbi:hypothetical protein AB434_3706 [Heyndrickxia coagulans]|uniref:Uncharacterized protein n=1 Tax=Heyndrickxia coagulans TaxID=1398 RepID=A0AAN0T664_HEYCO|nr:hypothetical protein SB48_HM08orf02458 [Heyndrickxia coagulans]AKN56111.1 hypothetical protein AB434_3706 [Heyndrickxia coagulans]KYC91935.1 hypothetical protein B4096_2891 [Heyndrickxia coagulans]
MALLRTCTGCGMQGDFLPGISQPDFYMREKTCKRNSVG